MSVMPRRPAFAVAAVLACGLATALAFGSGLAAAPQAPRLTLERASSSRPKLDGTPPANPVWSPDSRHVAFMWDDTGMGERNIWVAAATGGAPRRLTDLAKEFPTTSRGTMDADQLRLATMMMMRGGGLADMIWAPDSAAAASSASLPSSRIPPITALSIGRAKTRFCSRLPTFGHCWR